MKPTKTTDITITITKKQIIKYINKQPDDRPIQFRESEVHTDQKQCGCLLVHLFRYKFKGYKGHISCGFRGATGLTRSDHGQVSKHITTPGIAACSDPILRINTYGELKKNIDHLFV